jgi:glycosyltransferase involved in cell wall biosynthesis
MRIAIVSSFPPYRGGIAHFNQALLRALEEEGHDVMAINWSRQYPRIFFPGVSQLEEGGRLADGPPALLDSIRPSTWNRVARHLVESRIDLLILPFWHAALAPPMAHLAKKVRRGLQAVGHPIQVVGLMHNACSHDASGWDTWLVHRLLGRLDRAWTLSAKVAMEIELMRDGLAVDTLFHPLYDHFPDRISAEDARRLLHLPPAEEAHVVLYFGLIRPYKGLDVLIDAISILEQERLAGVAEKPVYLVIAGECYGEWEPYQNAIDASAAADFIQIHARFIPDHEVALFFSAADCVALPYRKASQSGVTAIALHYGIPIVASDVGGLAEYILPGETGTLVPHSGTVHEDAIRFSTALRTTLAGQWNRNHAAFDQARARFSWQSFVHQALMTTASEP